MKIRELVQNLPEVYQPIFSHPELSADVSRPCADRLGAILRACSAIEKLLGRPLRILDLGCAQGYFSLMLASQGWTACGVDFNEDNIRLCQALVSENSSLDVSFTKASIQDFVDTLKSGEYDVVLGLSVFHHIAHASGLSESERLIGKIAALCKVVLVELALSSEPLYWADSQPEDPRSFLSAIAFKSKISSFTTHLSDISRPLFFASNSIYYLGGSADYFNSWTDISNPQCPGIHLGYRFFYKGDAFVKHYHLKGTNAGERGEIDLKEYKNEVYFLEEFGSRLGLPLLLGHGRSIDEAWIIRDYIDGVPLDEIIIRGDLSFSPLSIALDIGSQLSDLESFGLTHSDIRTWNVIVDANSKAWLIDFGAVTPGDMDCLFPHSSYYTFALFVMALFDGLRSPLDPVTQEFAIRVLPVTVQHAIIAMLCATPSEKPFKTFTQVLRGEVCVQGSGRPAARMQA